MAQKLNKSIFHFPSAVGWNVLVITDPEGRDDIEDYYTVHLDSCAMGDPKSSSHEDEMNVETNEDYEYGEDSCGEEEVEEEVEQVWDLLLETW